ncbi:MAG: CvpA family protein [Myxococcota bacterium]
MILDALALVLLVVGAWAGWNTGALTQGARLGLLVLAVLAARALTPPIAGFYLRVTEGATVEWAVGAGFLVVFVGLAAVLRLALRRLTEDLAPFDRGQVDRFVSAALGAVKGLLVAYVVAVGLHQVAVGSGRGAAEWEESRLGRFALSRDFLRTPVQAVATSREAADRPVLRGWERRTGEP